MRILVNTTESGYMFKAGKSMNDEFVLQPIRNLRGVSDTRAVILAIVDTTPEGSPQSRFADDMIRQKYMKIVESGELTGISQRHVAVLVERPDGRGGTYPTYATLDEITGSNGVVSPKIFEKAVAATLRPAAPLNETVKPKPVEGTASPVTPVASEKPEQEVVMSGASSSGGQKAFKKQ